MIATITAIAEKKNVWKSLLVCGNHFLVIVAITAIIYENQPTYGNCSAIKVATTAQLFFNAYCYIQSCWLLFCRQLAAQQIAKY